MYTELCVLNCFVSDRCHVNVLVTLFSCLIPHHLFSSPGPLPSSPGLSDSPAVSRVMLVNGQKQQMLGLGQSPDGRQPSPLTSPLLTEAGFVRTDDEDEVRRKVCLSWGGK